MGYDLSTARVGDIARCRIGGEILNLRITSVMPEVWGTIGLYQYNITKIHKLITEKPEQKKDWDIFEIADEDSFHGYKPERSLFEVTDYVHRFKVGNKTAMFIINYHDKLWTCKIYDLFNPDSNIALYGFTGGVYYSVEEYIKHCEEETIEVLKSHIEQCKAQGIEIYGGVEL